MALAIVACASGLALIQAGPNGKYCGAIEGVADLSVESKGPNAFDVKATLMGTDIVCKSEAFTFDEKSGEIKLPGIEDPNDCLGKVADEFGVTGDTVVIKYDKPSNTINVDIGFGSVTLKFCGAWEILLKPQFMIPGFRGHHGVHDEHGEHRPHRHGPHGPHGPRRPLHEQYHGEYRDENMDGFEHPHHCCRGCGLFLLIAVTGTILLGKRYLHHRRAMKELDQQRQSDYAQESAPENLKPLMAKTLVQG